MTVTQASPINLERLIKFMGMTTAANDGEALAAMRLANREIAKGSVTWEEFLRGKVTIIADPFASIATPTTNSDWKPRNATPTPPPPSPPPINPYVYQAPPRAQKRAQPTPPRYNPFPSSPPPPKPAAPPPPPPPQQNLNAKVSYAKRQGQWILKSDSPLMIGPATTVIRKDGVISHERVGSLIHSDAGGYYYNIDGKTNFASVSTLGVV